MCVEKRKKSSDCFSLFVAVCILVAVTSTLKSHVNPEVRHYDLVELKIKRALPGR